MYPRFGMNYLSQSMVQARLEAARYEHDAMARAAHPRSADSGAIWRMLGVMAFIAVVMTVLMVVASVTGGAGAP
ncbi:MAG TPA: hypothetical protein VGM83_09290 [Devosiaceae bacterium]